MVELRNEPGPAQLRGTIPLVDVKTIVLTCLEKTRMRTRIVIQIRIDESVAEARRAT